MKILYDYQILILQRFGGISRYYFELINSINKRTIHETECHALFSKNYYFEKYFHKKSLVKYPAKTSRIINLSNEINTIIRSKTKYDIIHPTYYNPYIINKFKGKLVITVYDMIHEIYPEMFSNDDQTANNKKKLIYASDKIIAISNSTKRDIMNIYHDLDPNKIVVVYLGNSLKFEKGSKIIDFLPKDYILFVGERKRYKNFENFLKAFNISTQNSSMNLICAGGGAFSKDEKAEIEAFGLTDKVHQYSFDDYELAYTYSKANCFVFPSKYEGFGIPILEAFACNCPAILSNTSSLPEIGGDAAVYFNPEDVQEMASQISKVIYDNELRRELINKGSKRIKMFNWDKMADETIEVYKSIL